MFSNIALFMPRNTHSIVLRLFKQNNVIIFIDVLCHFSLILLELGRVVPKPLRMLQFHFKHRYINVVFFFCFSLKLGMLCIYS